MGEKPVEVRSIDSGKPEGREVPAWEGDREAVGGVLRGAAGAVEAIFTVLAMRDNIAPPTLNLDNPSVNTAINLVPHTAQKREINTALSNSFGFGGTNASILLRRVA